MKYSGFHLALAYQGVMNLYARINTMRERSQKVKPVIAGVFACLLAAYFELTETAARTFLRRKP